MAKENTATFIGHSEYIGLDRALVRKEIEKLIECGISEFLCGGMGAFDWLCAGVVYELKREYPHISNCLVIPYLSFSVLEPSYFDAIVYPEGFERYHFKAAIPARNRYMIDNSSVALCFVSHGWGGAAKSYSYANKKGIKLINLWKPKVK